MMDIPQTAGDTLRHITETKCLQCRACLECDEVQCLFHARGDPDYCAIEKCKYCMDFLKKQRLYMNNVG